MACLANTPEGRYKKDAYTEKSLTHKLIYKG